MTTTHRGTKADPAAHDDDIPTPLPDELVLGRLDPATRALAHDLNRAEAGELVDLYYRIQRHRIALGNQAAAAKREGRESRLSEHFTGGFSTLERQAQSVLDVWSKTTEVGRWSRSQKGIGPVLAAGFMAHIDIERAPTVGHIWAFAGLAGDGQKKWEKGQKRPWNAALKLVCWKTGQSFTKVSGREDAYYGQVYRNRKELEIERNNAGVFAEQAELALATRPRLSPNQREAYEAGKLPPGRLELRAQRYAVKLFLAHWHEVAYWEHYGEAPPLPYATTQLQHAHRIPVPDWTPNQRSA